MFGSILRAFSSILVGAGFLLASPVAAVAQNLLNGDFDLWTGSSPNYWSMASTTGTIGLAQDTTVYYSSPTWAGNTKSCRLSLAKGSSSSTNGWFGKTWGSTIGYSVGSTVSAKFRVKLATPFGTGGISVEAIGLDAAGNPVGAPGTVALATNTTAWQTADVTYVIPNPLPSNVYLRVKFIGVPNIILNVDAAVFTWTSNDFLAGFGRDPVREPYDLVTAGLTVRVDNVNATLADMLSTVGATTTNPGTSLVEPPNSDAEKSKLFALQYYRTNYSSGTADSLDFVHTATAGAPFHFGASPTFAASVSSGKRILTVTFDGSFQQTSTGTIDLLDVKPQVVVQASPLNGSGVSFQTSVDNHTYQGKSWDLGANWAIEKTYSPLPQMAPTLGASSTDDRVFVPLQSGGLIYHDALTYNASGGNRILYDYPGAASLQYIAYFDPSIGMMMTSMDGTAVTATSAPSPKKFGYQRNIGTGSSPPNWFDMRIAYMSPAVFGGDIASAAIPLPPVVLQETHGTWMKSAEVYRQWARSQPWAHSPGTPPSWLANRPTSFNLFLRPEAIGLHTAVVRNTMSSEPLFDMFDGWSQSIGPMLGLFRAFERYGTYVGPYYAPFDTQWFDSTELSSHWFGLRSQHNVNIMTMVASLKWMTDRPQSPCVGLCNATYSYWNEVGSKMVYDVNGNLIDGTLGGGDSGLPGLTVPSAANVCTQTMSGQLYDPWATGTPPSWDGKNYRICPSTSFAKGLHEALSTYQAAMGVQLYEFDQLNGGGTPPCYAGLSAGSIAHSHAPGFGPWMIFETASMLSQARAFGQAVDLTFAIGLEDLNELMLPYVDVFLTDVGAFDKQWANPWQSEAIPAFNYVYGDLTQIMDRTHSLKVYNMADDGTGHSSVDVDAQILARTCVFGGWQGIELQPWMLSNDLIFNTPPYQNGWTYPGNPWTLGLLDDFFLQNGFASNLPSPNAIVPYVSKTNSQLLTVLANAGDVAHDPVVLNIMEHGPMVEPAGQSVPTVNIWDNDGVYGVWHLRIGIPAVVMGSYQLSNGTNPPTIGLIVVNPNNAPVSVTLPSTFGSFDPIGKAYSIRVPFGPFTSSGLTWHSGIMYMVPANGVVFFKIN